MKLLCRSIGVALLLSWCIKKLVRVLTWVALALVFQITLHAQNWFPCSAPLRTWQGLAISQDGSRLVGVGGTKGNPNLIYVSADGGTNWTATSAPAKTYLSVAWSADGSKILAGEFSASGLLYQSTDFGLTWTNLSADANQWNCVASSADGSVLVAGTYGGLLWTSTNSGATWTHPAETVGYWRSVVCSTNGDLLLATGGSDRNSAFISRDFGASWQLITNIPSLSWTAAVSSDGTKLALASTTGQTYSSAAQTYTSVDSGLTWFSNSVPNVAAEQIACSGDGSILVMGAMYGIYSSTDWGVTWTVDSAPDNVTFNKIACSADGSKMAAASDQIYTSPSVEIPSNVAAWGDTTAGATTVPPNIGPAIAVAAGQYVSVAVKSNHTVVAWGDNSRGQTNVPVGLSNVVSVVVGSDDCLALKADGTLFSWGSSVFANTPAAKLSNITAVAANSMGNYAALRSNGTVVVWGYSYFGLTNVPASATNLVAVALGDFFSIGLRADGTLIEWGQGANNLISENTTNVVSIAAGSTGSAYIKSDGTLALFPNNNYPISTPAGLSNVVVVSLTGGHFVALTADGSVWDSTYRVGLPYAQSIAAGFTHALAIVGDGSVQINRQPYSQTAFTGANILLNVGASGMQPLNYQWQYNGTDIAGATTANLAITNVPLSAAGTYSCIVTNGLGAAVTAPATLTVLRSTPQFDSSNASWSAATGFTLPLHGLSGHGDIVIYASDDLMLWDPIYTNPPTVGSLQWLDPDATNFPMRFYRAEER